MSLVLEINYLILSYLILIWGSIYLSKHREVSLAQESIPCTSKCTAPGVQSSITIALQKQKVYDINDPCAKAISKHIGKNVH